MNRWLTPLLFSVLLGSSVVGLAQSVTFHADVAPIIYTHCTECHRVGEIGPMPLTNYAVFVLRRVHRVRDRHRLHAPMDARRRLLAFRRRARVDRRRESHAERMGGGGQT